MKTRSLARQVIVIVLLAQVAGALVLSGIALLHERHTRLRAFDVRLMGRSDSLLGAIQDADDPADNVAIDPAELRLPPEDVYAVYNQDGRLIGSSVSAPPVLIARVRDGFRESTVGATLFRVYQRNALRIIDRGENAGVGLRRPVTLVYASPERHIWPEIFRAVGFYLLAIGLVLLLTALIVFALLRSALRPLADLATATGQLSAPSLAFSAPPSALSVRELRPLAEVLAEVIDRLKDAFAKEQRFVGDAAHELKTAVAVVRSTVQVLMLRPRTAEEHRVGLDRILEDNSRVERLVAQMLSSASGQQAPSLDVPSIDLDQNVRLALAQMESVAEAHRVELRFDSSGPADVRVSPQHIAVLVSNLVLNAIQHSCAGASVSISIRREAAAQTVVLTVADTGAGIGADALPHVFERFFREDVSRSRSTGGAGLGLAICKSIVDAAGGLIEINSAPGKGTTVVVTFIGV